MKKTNKSFKIIIGLIVFSIITLIPLSGATYANTEYQNGYISLDDFDHGKYTDG